LAGHRHVKTLDSTACWNVSGRLNGAPLFSERYLWQALRPGVDVAHKDGHDFAVQIDIHQTGLLNLSADLDIGPSGNRDRLVPIFQRFNRDEWRHYAVEFSHTLWDLSSHTAFYPSPQVLQRGDVDLGAAPQSQCSSRDLHHRLRGFSTTFLDSSSPTRLFRTISRATR
jgi:hypothetical protein